MMPKVISILLCCQIPPHERQGNTEADLEDKQRWSHTVVLHHIPYAHMSHPLHIRYNQGGVHPKYTESPQGGQASGRCSLAPLHGRELGRRPPSRLLFGYELIER